MTDRYNDEATPDRSPWVICPHCEGDGHHAKHLGSFTMSEFYETYDDEESRENYFSGAYDTPCIPCGSSGKIRQSQLEAAMEMIREENRRYRMAETGRNEWGEPI